MENLKELKDGFIYLVRTDKVSYFRKDQEGCLEIIDFLTDEEIDYTVWKLEDKKFFNEK